MLKQIEIRKNGEIFANVPINGMTMLYNVAGLPAPILSVIRAWLREEVPFTDCGQWSWKWKTK